ncbi:unnamed protein product [Durusdinium trenchii]|uniref:Uncharacterized protein n=1 Tax=Durusdinium trenchii TaxID=1381693 RepID=A0ABP0I6D9_9DINO
MRPLGGAKVFILDDSLQPCPKSMDEITGLLGVAGPQVRGRHDLPRMAQR